MMDIDVVLFWDLFCTLSGIGAFLSLAFYLVPITLLTFARPQNLLKKYGDWAVVTGGSSGIGKAIAFKLASQGVNVCIVALDDDLLKTAYSDMKQQFPKVQVRAIPVNLGKSPEAYMKAVARGTEDVRVSIFVNNAGFLVMGFFHETSIERYMGNLECNATSAIRLTHYFYKRMIEQNIRGCIMYTSSAAFFLPAPFASLYGASKALLSHFATSLAVEAESYGIDVTVFHPSYTHSNLYAETPKLDIVALLSKIGWTPESVANVMLSSVGRVVVRDIGIYAVATNLLGRFLDPGTLTKLIIPFRDSMAPKSPQVSKREEIHRKKR